MCSTLLNGFLLNGLQMVQIIPALVVPHKTSTAEPRTNFFGFPETTAKKSTMTLLLPNCSELNIKKLIFAAQQLQLHHVFKNTLQPDFVNTFCVCFL
jgi:hypothetical protein